MDKNITESSAKRRADKRWPYIEPEMKRNLSDGPYISRSIMRH